MEIMNRYECTTHYIECSFKGGIYKISFSKYGDCVVIREILYICDTIDKNNPPYKNIVLIDHEVIYKQLETLIKKKVK